MRLRKTAGPARAAAPDAFFLQRRAAEDIVERLLAVPRSFQRALLFDPTDAMRDAIAQTPEISNRIGEIVAVDGISSLCVESLDLETEAFDLIVSPLVLHWANDLPGALVQLRLALKADGLLMASILGGETLQELRAALLEAEAALTGGVALRVGPFAQLHDLAGLLQRAGFALPAADRDLLTVRYANPLGLIRDLRAMGETAAFPTSERAPLRRDVAAAALAAYTQYAADPDGRVRATFEILTATGWRPHASQQQPLKPGSAKTRLADALKTTEHALKRED